MDYRDIKYKTIYSGMYIAFNPTTGKIITYAKKMQTVIDTIKELGLDYQYVIHKFPKVEHSVLDRLNPFK